MASPATPHSPGLYGYVLPNGNLPYGGKVRDETWERCPCWKRLKGVNGHHPGRLQHLADHREVGREIGLNDVVHALAASDVHDSGGRVLDAAVDDVGGPGRGRDFGIVIRANRRRLSPAYGYTGSDDGMVYRRRCSQSRSCGWSVLGTRRSIPVVAGCRSRCSVAYREQPPVDKQSYSYTVCWNVFKRLRRDF